MKKQQSLFFKTARLIKLVQVLILFTCITLLGCGSSNNKSNSGGGRASETPAIEKTDNIVITAIEVRPNPLNIWPDPNAKFDGCSVVVTFKNDGEGTCTDELVFTAYFSKADNTLNNSFAAAQAMPFEGRWKKGLIPGETAYVQMSMSGWLILNAANGQDLSATYKVTMKGYREKNGVLLGDHISEGSPEILYQIVHHR